MFMSQDLFPFTGRFLSQDYRSCSYLVLSWVFSLYHQLIVCDINFLFVKGNLCLLLTCVPYCDQEPFLLTGNSFLLQEIFSYDKKFVPMTTYFVIWREIFLTLFMTGILQHGNLLATSQGESAVVRTKTPCEVWGFLVI